MSNQIGRYIINTGPLDDAPEDIQIENISEFFSKYFIPALLLMALAASKPETKKKAGIRSGERYLLKITHISAGIIPAVR